MTAFAYQAVDATGRRTRGVIEAGNAAGARRALRDRALLPVSVIASHGAAETREAAPRGGLAALRTWRARRVSRRAVATATRQLSTLIGGAVRIEEALRLIAVQNDSPGLTALLFDIRSTVLEGSSFARALARHPQVFPAYFCASIAAGETSGRLAEVLAYLADFVEARHRAGQKLWLALIYPALLAVVSGGMMTMLMIYVVPDIVKVFINRGADLPLLTRMLMGLSSFIARFGIVTLVVAIGAVVLARRELARPARRLAFDRVMATRWPFARFSRQTNAARFAATLATLVQSSVPLLDALTAAAVVIPNAYVHRQAMGVATRVREGESVHRALAAAEIFPPMLVAIVASGETGGELGPALARAAAELDRDVETQVGLIVSLVEPAVLLLMGGLVLLMVMAILSPIIGLNNLAGK